MKVAIRKFERKGKIPAYSVSSFGRMKPVKRKIPTIVPAQNPPHRIVERSPTTCHANDYFIIYAHYVTAKLKPSVNFFQHCFKAKY